MFSSKFLRVVTLAVVSTIAASACHSSTESTDRPMLTYNAQDSYQFGTRSLWNSEFYNDRRFTLNIKLTAEEKKEARKWARTFGIHINDGKLFMQYLLSELKSHNMPVELAVIPILESGFNMRAKSPAGAHGPWQFIRSTGKIYGLERNGRYDEFYDFIESTQASLKYFAKLYRDCGNNWELAAAAYNQGEYGIIKSIKRARDKGVKDINPSTVSLNASAHRYIRRFRVYAELLHHPELYGVRLPELNNRPAFKRVQIAGRLSSMKKASELSGVQIGVLRHLNAGYLSDSLRTGKNHPLLVPIEGAYRLERAIGIKDNTPAATLSAQNTIDDGEKKLAN